MLAITSGGSPAISVTSPGAVTLTATTTSNSSPVTAGTVNFCYSTQLSCSGAALVGTAQLTAAGTASISLRPAVGSHSYQAVFLGTASAASSKSAASILTVTQGTGTVLPTLTTIAASGTAGNYTLTGTVTGDGLTASTGTVSFLDVTNSNMVIGSATLGNAVSGPGFLQVPATTNFANATPLVSGDFNGDGVPDLIAALADSSLVSQLGNGDGSFTTKATIPGGASQVVTGDFNSDGKLDIATISAGNVSVFLGDGTGAFTAAPAGSPISVGAPTGSPSATNSMALAVGDFNKDGILDLAVANGETVYLYTGVGDGTFTAGYSLQLTFYPYSFAFGGSNGLVAGDFNADGNLDLAVAWNVVGVETGGNSEFNVAFFFGDGTGNFTLSSVTLPADETPIFFSQDPLYQAPPGSMVIVASDINDDGKTDLTASLSYYGCCPGQPITSTFNVLSNGDGTFTTPQTQSDPTLGAPLAVAAVDLKGDGTTQITTRWDLGVPAPLSSDTPQPAHIDYGGGSLTLPSGVGAGFVTGDFNGDGIPDIAIGGPIATSLVGYQTAATAVADHAAVSPGGSGTHQVRASYPGDATHAASVSATTGLDSGPAVVLSVPGTASFGSTVTLTATVTSSGAVPTGTMVFLNGSASLGSATLVNGAASLPVANLAPGAYIITAVYSGDANYGGATSAPATLTITKANPAIALTLSAATISVGAMETLTATVTSSSAVPTGTVAFLNGSTSLGSATLVSGMASLPVSNLAPGSYTITALYSGDANYGGVTSAPATLTVTKENSAIVLTASAPTIPVGGVETLTVTLPAADSAPGGSVTFSQGGTTLGTKTVTGSTAALTTTALSAGIDSFTATWTGDSNFAGSTSAAVTVMVTPSLTLTSSASTIYAGTADSITVTMGTGNNAAVPTGTLTLSSGSFTTAPVTLSAGTATIQIPANTLPDGTDTLMVSYSGDAVYPPATGTITVTVSSAQPPGFTLSSPSLTLAAGATTGNTVAVTLTPVTGFTGTVTLTAKVTSSPANANDPPTVSFGSGSTVAISGTAPVTATLTITTTGSTVARGDMNRPDRMRWLGSGGAVLACLVLIGIPRRRPLQRMRNLLLWPVLLVALMGVITACGGKSKGMSVPGTTSGSYTITVTGTSGAVTSSGTVTLTVQ